MPPDLPLTFRPPQSMVHKARLAFVACELVTVAAFVTALALDLHPLVGLAVVLLVSSFAELSWLIATERLVLEETGLDIKGDFFSYRVPWPLLDAVDVDPTGKSVVCRLSNGRVVTAGPFEDPSEVVDVVGGVRSAFAGRAPEAVRRRPRFDVIVLVAFPLVLAAVLLRPFIA